MWIKNDNDFIKTPDGHNFNKLPYGNYVIQKSMSGFYLNKIDDFKLPDKIYGNVEEKTNIVLKTFFHKKENTNALFSGKKGSGKTILAKSICISSGLPCIIINSILSPEEQVFLSSIEEEIIVFIDEFEKLYFDEKIRNSLLQLLDGSLSSNKRLFLLTSNANYIGTFFTNRLGRIRYNFKFDNLPENIIIEVIDDLLINKDFKESLLKIVLFLNINTLDIIINIIEECNIHNINPLVLINYLNLTTDDETSYDVIHLDSQKKVGTIYSKEFLNLYSGFTEYVNLGYRYLSNEEILEIKKEFDNAGLTWDEDNSEQNVFYDKSKHKLQFKDLTSCIIYENEKPIISINKKELKKVNLSDIF